MKAIKLLLLTVITVFTSCNKNEELFTFYQDADGDGLGNPNVSIEAATAPDGYVDNADDEDDTSPGLTTFYLDSDGDGLGDPNNSIETQVIPEGYVANADDNDDSEVYMDIVSQTMQNLHAPQTTDYSTTPPTTTGDFVRFDFSSGEITTSDTDWDIAFRGTTILVNGGASSGIAEEPSRTGNAGVYIETSSFTNITSVTEASFIQDSTSGLAIPTGSGNGWYTYDPTTHLISPIAGKILVVRTADERYAKVEILSYYKDSDSSDLANSRYYSFNYVYQPNNGVTTFE